MLFVEHKLEPFLAHHALRSYKKCLKISKCNQKTYIDGLHLSKIVCMLKTVFWLVVVEYEYKVLISCYVRVSSCLGCFDFVEIFLYLKRHKKKFDLPLCNLICSFSYVFFLWVFLQTWGSALRCLRVFEINLSACLLPIDLIWFELSSETI